MYNPKKILSIDQFRILNEDKEESDSVVSDPSLEPPKEGKSRVDTDTGQKVYNKRSLPKEQQLVALAKELYNSIVDATQFKYVIQDKLDKMKGEGASDEDLSAAQEIGSDQQSALQDRASGIEQQMSAVAGDSDILSDRAEELSSEAKNLAGKENKRFFDSRMKKLEDDFEKKRKERKKEAAEKFQDVHGGSKNSKDEHNSK